jgi:hypothetical protein
MSGDPFIDEDQCIFMLQQEINQETLPYHQNAALQVVMDLYDRKVTREEFARNAGTAISFYATLAKMHVVAQTRAMQEAGTLDYAVMASSTAKLAEIAAGKARSMIQCVAMLRECATTQDTVH